MSNYLKVFKLYSQYYNLIYNNKNYKQEVESIIKLLKKFKFKKKNILNLVVVLENMQNFLLKKDIKFMVLKKVKI